MTRKDYYVGLAILVDALVILAYSLSNWDNFLSFLSNREPVGILFWIGFFWIVWHGVHFYIKGVVKVANKKD